MNDMGKALLRPLVVVAAGLLLISAGAVGCGAGAAPGGWSGGVVGNDNLFLGSMTGKLVALNTSTGLRAWQDFSVTVVQPAFFGCSSSSQPVPIYGTPAVAGDLVYFGGYNGKIYALNAGTGADRWIYPREGSLKPIVGGVVAAGGNLYFTSASGSLYALDAVTGDSKWEFPTGDKIWATPTVSGDTIYVGSFDKKLYAVDSDGSQKWVFATEGAIVSSPAIADGTIYLGSFDRHLYAVNADGSLKWKSDFNAGKWFWAGLVVAGGKVYAPNLDGKVYVVDAGTGEKLAEPDLGAPVSSSPVVVDNLIVVATEKGAVYALDNDQPRLIASLKTSSGGAEVVYAPLYSSDGVVYIHTQTQPGEAVYALNPATGQVLWHIRLAD